MIQKAIGNPISPIQKGSSFTASRKDNDCEDSALPNSSFSKNATFSEKHKGQASCAPVTKKAPKAEEQKKKEAKKSVQFNKRVRIRKIRRLETMSAVELESTYFSEKELMAIRIGLRSKIRGLVENYFEECTLDDETVTIDDCATFDSDINDEEDEDDGHFCIRGLEHEFPGGKSRRKQLKMMSRGAVLEEQRLQREFYVGGDDSMRGSCSTHDTIRGSTSTHETMSSTATFACMSHDPAQAIAEIYRIESKPAVLIALEFGKRDEAAADQIYFSHEAT